MSRNALSAQCLLSCGPAAVRFASVVVAVISGIGRFTDPWGDLVNYFRDVNITQVKFRLMSVAVNQ